MFFSDSWRGPFQRKQVFGNSPHIFFRAHCQVRGLSIVTNSWIGLGICPKKVKFVSNWLEAKEKKTFFFIWKKKSWVRNVKKSFFQKSWKVAPIGLNYQTTIYEPVQNGFQDQSRKISIFREKAKKNNFLVNSKR